LKRIGGNGEDSIGKPVLVIFFLPDSLLMPQKYLYSCPLVSFYDGSIMPDILNQNDIYRKVEDVVHFCCPFLYLQDYKQKSDL
jgi:hypothetical protein